METKKNKEFFMNLTNEELSTINGGSLSASVWNIIADTVKGVVRFYL
jgi:bacteriocin-like protein